MRQSKKSGKFGVLIPKKSLTVLLNKGSELLNNNQLRAAVNVFTFVIELDPYWAEAWNKRATVLYLLGEFQKSQMILIKYWSLKKDILVLLLERSGQYTIKKL